MRLGLLLISMFLVQNMYSQCENGRLVNADFKRISNEHRTNIAFSWGMISYQGLEDNFYYANSDDPLFYLGYGKSIWVSAVDTSGELRVSANSFPTIVGSDFIAGPLDRDTGLPIDTLCSVYNRVWKVEGFDVFLLRQAFESGNINEEDIPIDILEWPAKGNPHLGDFAPDFDLAPFIDVAEDGIYDPLSGDYPIPLEESPEFVADQFSFTVTNDVSFQQLTRGEPIGIELQQMNYVVSCSEESQSEYSVFTRVKYKYLGQRPLAKFQIALWEDNDLGCNQNDYTGCDKDLNCTYFYNRNGDTFIGDCGVDFDPPNNNGALRTTVFLNKEMLSFRHWWLLGVGTQIVQGIDPAGDEEYFRYMNNLWRDSIPVTVGGNGYNVGSTDVTLFSYPDRPNDSNGWSMQTANLPAPLDVRALTTLVDMPLDNGAEDHVDFADLFIYEPTKKKLTVFDELTPRVTALKEDYQAMLTGEFMCAPEYELCFQDCVWPGDVNRDGGVTAKDFIICGAMSGLGIPSGPPRAFESTNWFGFKADEWGVDLNGTDLKYGDVNGNGMINLNDLQRIENNLGLQRPWFYDADELLEVESDFRLRAFKSKDTIDVVDALVFQRLFNTSVFLEDAQGPLRTPLHGVSFEMHFDTNLVTPFVKIDDNFSQVFEYGYVGMAGGFRDGNELLGNNEIECAFTNYTNNEVTSGGLLVEQNFYVRENAKTPNLDGKDTLVIKFYDVCAIDGEGNPVEIGSAVDTLIISGLEVDTDVISSVEEEKVSEQYQLFPNPTTGIATVAFTEPTSGMLSVYDITGREVLSEELSDQQEMAIDLRGVSDGVFMVRFEPANKEPQVQKLILSRN